MSKILFGILTVLVLMGCGKSPEPVERTPETTPWFFPEKQIEILSSPHFMARGLAVKRLGEMGAKAEVAIPELEKLLESEKEPKIRVLAEQALEKIRAAMAEAEAE